MRALIPAFTVFISYAWLRKTFSVRIHAAIVIMFVGVFVYAAKGELDYTYYGLVMTLLGGFFSALKGVVTNVFLVGPLKLPTLQLLKIMSFYSGASPRDCGFDYHSLLFITLAHIPSDILMR